MGGLIMITEEERMGIISGKLIRVCNKCGCEVVYDDWGDYVNPNYNCACLVCDEDLDLWETKLVTKDLVKMFITTNDINYYMRNGHLPNKKLDLLE